MTNSNQSAFAYAVGDGVSGEPGLTKREYFAAMAMQANADNDATPEEIAFDSVKLADALIAELNKPVA
jgi:hypothetical protein